MEPLKLLELKKHYHIAINSAFEIDKDGIIVRMTEQDVSKMKSWEAFWENNRNEIVTFKYADERLKVTVRTLRDGKDIDAVTVYDKNGDFLKTS